MNNLSSYKHVQEIAKETMQFLESEVIPGMTEIEIKNIAESYMMGHGVESFWYYNVGAFVFVGNRTVLSISGRDYIPTKQKVQLNDVVTVDLSPCIGTTWGDYARTFVFGENDLSSGVEFQKHLHRHLSKIIIPEITFHDIYHEMNNEIEKNGYLNLDFNSNLGHTIEDEREKRRYIENENRIKIKDISFFTFEPHISKNKSKNGYKMENIYYIDSKELKEL